MYVGRLCGTEKISLLKAPSAEAKEMWKAQAFDFARNRLRPKLSKTVTADMLITVMQEHFIYRGMFTYCALYCHNTAVRH